MAGKDNTTHYGSDSGKQAAAIQDNPKPTSQEVDDFHTNADTDTRAESLHHTLGAAGTQASPGDHNHDGGSSNLLLVGQTISGSRATDAYRLSINAILVKLGATDSSTP
jgi:hypothetical protein